MKPIPFIPETDLAPRPFGENHSDLAYEMKKRGLMGTGVMENHYLVVPVMNTTSMIHTLGGSYE